MVNVLGSLFAAVAALALLGVVALLLPQVWYTVRDLYQAYRD